jgi:hypothetical protein
MKSIDDIRLEALRGWGYTGSLQDMLIKWYLTNGATSKQINDAEYQFLLARGITPPFTIKDGWYRYFSLQGLSGAFADKQLSYWRAGPVTETPLLEITNKYFRRNKGTNDYAAADDVVMSGDVVIEFDIHAPPQDDNNALSFRNLTALSTFGLASGRDLQGNTSKLRLFSSAVPAIDVATTTDVFDNILHTVKVEYTAATNSVRVIVDGVEDISPRTCGYNFNSTDVLTVWRDVTTGDEMEGIISNLRIFDAGSLAYNWPLGSNASTEDSTVNGEVLTFVNSTSDDWRLFTRERVTTSDRYYRTNKGDTDYLTIPMVSLSGEFSIEFDAMIESPSSSCAVLGNSVNADSFLAIYADGSIRFSIDGAAAGSVAGVWDDGVTNKVTFTRDASNNISVTLNSVEVASGVTASLLEFDLLMRYTSAGFGAAGTLSNIKIHDGGVLIRDYLVDDNSNTLTDKASGQWGAVINGEAEDWFISGDVGGDWFGPELINNGKFDTDTSWGKGTGWSISGGLANLVSNGSASNLSQDGVFTIGRKYLYGFNVETDGDPITAQSSGGQTITGLSGSTGRLETYWVADSDAALFKRLSGSPTGYIDNVVAKEVLEFPQ